MPGRYVGTLVGVTLIVLLNSVLSIMQMPEAGRQMIYGSVIIGMLLVYGRGSRNFWGIGPDAMRQDRPDQANHVVPGYWCALATSSLSSSPMPGRSLRAILPFLMISPPSVIVDQ